MVYFDALSANQSAAIGKPCKDCGTGVYVQRNGRLGLFVGCSRYPNCKGKVFRPRGKYVTDNDVKDIGDANKQVIDTDTSPDVPIASGELIKGDSMGGIESAIVDLVMPHIQASLSKVSADATQVTALVKQETRTALGLITAELAKLQAAKPTYILIS